jgi:hypothetical protein
MAVPHFGRRTKRYEAMVFAKMTVAKRSVYEHAPPQPLPPPLEEAPEERRWMRWSSGNAAARHRSHLAVLALLAAELRDHERREHWPQRVLRDLRLLARLRVDDGIALALRRPRHLRHAGLPSHNVSFFLKLSDTPPFLGSVCVVREAEARRLRTGAQARRHFTK